METKQRRRVLDFIDSEKIVEGGDGLEIGENRMVMGINDLIQVLANFEIFISDTKRHD